MTALTFRTSASRQATAIAAQNEPTSAVFRGKKLERETESLLTEVASLVQLTNLLQESQRGGLVVSIRLCGGGATVHA